METGKLYLVSTPIGNLGDITLRALETLKQVDYIASEDTRHTGRMLKHFEISKPQISFHEHNEHRAIGRIVGLLDEGKSIALVTSAGTPSISDPGFIALWEAVKSGIEVTAIPGPTALVTALVLSGMPVYSFTFRGFPPQKPGKRRKFLEMDKDSPHTLIYYESPYRLRKLLLEALDVFGNRHAAVCKELTKMYERVTRGRISQLLDELEEKPKGEYVVVIAGAEYVDKSDEES